MTFAPDWAGADEVGRGALAGPLVAAAVVWSADRVPACAPRLRDSKQLTAAQRSRLARELGGDPAVRYAVTWAHVQDIDRLNILQATLQALAAAVTALGSVPGVYVDGNQAIIAGVPQQTVVGGDDLVPQISAASIIAKVFRDRWMECLDGEHPGYNWCRNRGYGTSDHLAALNRLGPSPQHRRSFAPIRQPAFDFAP